MTGRIYCGIGSRMTPAAIQKQMTTIASAMAMQGWTLRSGAAEGADKAFEHGADLAHGFKEIYLPWRGFNDHPSLLTRPSPDAYLLAQKFHPNWGALSEGGQKLMARNAHQLFGKDLNEPAELVICWTDRGLPNGGTGQALRMAEAYQIPIVNLGALDGTIQAAAAAIDLIIDPLETIT
jgi:hypothetical protein